MARCGFISELISQGPKWRRSRATSRAVRLRVRSCSQMRMTCQPARRNVRFTSRSRTRLAASLRRQNAALPFGFVPCCGQPCQKQPSTNTAKRSLGKMKSGRTRKGRGLRGEVRAAGFPLLSTFSTLISTCLRHPVMPCARNTRTSAVSVLALPRERTRAITSLRLAFVKMSGTGRGKPQRGDGAKRARNGGK